MKVIYTIVLVMVLSATAHAEDVLRVVTKENAIRQYCRFFAPVNAMVRYDDKLEFVSKEGDWFRVRFENTDGCIHKSAVEKKTFGLLDLMGPSEAGADEVALAGKGFNPQVEQSFREENQATESHYLTLDRIERYHIPPENLEQFIRQGGLNLP